MYSWVAVAAAAAAATMSGRLMPPGPMIPLSLLLRAVLHLPPRPLPGPGPPPGPPPPPMGPNTLGPRTTASGACSASEPVRASHSSSCQLSGGRSSSSRSSVAARSGVGLSRWPARYQGCCEHSWWPSRVAQSLLFDSGSASQNAEVPVTFPPLDGSRNVHVHQR